MNMGTSNNNTNKKKVGCANTHPTVLLQIEKFILLLFLSCCSQHR